MSAPSLVEDVFLAALEKDLPEERAAVLDAACKDDPDLRRRVERLLAAHPRAKGFMEVAPSPPETCDYVPTGEQVGAVIAGRYKLVEQIGEGGMGTVWVAQQTEPVRRVVAVKLIKAGMDSKAVLARFEAERQALALMDHPNISRVLDGGATPDGRPFFVMELVKGVPITRFCDAGKLTPRQRLELFIPVCQAIQHAHQKGIIHRDIKPSNVLIALYDDRPVPKVIDFGVAKATGQTLTDKSLMTGFGAVVGTPEYMSPEQASLNNLDVDTRSDVYSLGVLLYELLAGSPPFRSAELKQAGLMEMLRIVCEEDPPRPSFKLSTANTLASISADRGTEPKKLTGLLRNELDWIVMKALEKDRSRRYETVNGFAADVQRYLGGEAVQAHPPSAGYRLRKFARKHRVMLTTAAAFAGLLIAAAAVSGWLAVKATRAEAAAEAKKIEAQNNAVAAGKNAAEARRQTALAEEWAGKHLNARLEAELQARRLQIDLDIEALRGDARLGLLRLAKPYKQTLKGVKLQFTSDAPELHAFLNNPKTKHEFGSTDFGPLREFVAAAVLVTGQDFAPLLPPITHDGHEVTFTSLSPDSQTLLTLGQDDTARLWDTRTAKQIAILRQGDERVVNCGISPHGRTVFTDDQASVARFWELPDGKLRAATEARPSDAAPGDRTSGSRSSHPVAQISNNRLLTWKKVELKSDAGLNVSEVGPVELWDTATGRRVARLNVPDEAVESCQFLGDGRWVGATVRSEALVFAPEDGHQVARLPHPPGDPVWVGGVSPSGRTLITVSGDAVKTLRAWDTRSWQAIHAVAPIDFPSEWGPPRFRILSDDLFVLYESGFGDWLRAAYRIGQIDQMIEIPSNALGSLGRAGDLIHFGDGQVFDTRDWQRLVTPAGCRFHPDLVRFAPDGRFVFAAVGMSASIYNPGLIDTRADKHIPTNWGAQRGDLFGHGMDSPRAYLPGFGTLATYGPVLRLIPAPDKLDLSPDLLELWSQVAVCGEIGAEGRFEKWDEQTWENKRQELAAKPAPHPDFPFPGYVAADKLHWLRAEFGEAKADAEKLWIARELLRRCESAGDEVEAVRWRTEVNQQAPESTTPQQSEKP